MKWLIALFLVTWKTYDVRYNPFSEKESVPKCELVSTNNQEEYFDWFKATARATALKMDVRNLDVKVWELEEPPKFKERR